MLHALKSIVPSDARGAGVILWLCGALWTAAATPLGAQPAYRVVQVAPAGATYSSDAFVDPTGTYVAGIATTGIQVRPFLWTAGTSVYLATDAARLIFDSNVVVNASGQVAGSASTATDGSQAAFRWTVSSETRLQALYTTNFQGQLNTAALAINAAGDVVGRSDVNPSSVRAVRWPGGSASLTRVDNDRHAVARSINDAGVVVGSVLVYPCPTRADVQCWRAARWSNGAITTFEPAPGYMNSSAYDINEAGEIVGMAYNGNTQFAAMRWANGVGMALPTLNARNIMAANGINAAGRVVGKYLATQYRGFLWQDGITYDLTGLLDATGAGWEVRDATSIAMTERSPSRYVGTPMGAAQPPCSFPSRRRPLWVSTPAISPKGPRGRSSTRASRCSTRGASTLRSRCSTCPRRACRSSRR